jgi:hypothetical protein
MSEAAPSTNGPQTDGRDTRGRFAPGNRGGPGNPHAAAVGKYRAELFKQIKSSDIRLAVKTIREVMKRGKDADRLAAAKLLLERVLGAPEPADILDTLRVLEEHVERMERRR